MSPPAAKETPNDWSGIVRRLDAIIALMVRFPAPDKGPKVTEQIKALQAIGLENAIIGEILGKKSNYISASVGGKQSNKKSARKGKQSPAKAR